MNHEDILAKRMGATNGGENGGNGKSAAVAAKHPEIRQSAPASTAITSGVKRAIPLMASSSSIGFGAPPSSNPFAVPEQPAPKKRPPPTATGGGVVGAAVGGNAPSLSTPAAAAAAAAPGADDERPLGEWECLATDSIHFKCVQPDGSVIGTFKPLFAHAFFGEHEVIAGYKGFKGEIAYRSDTLDACLSLEWTETRDFGVSNVAQMISAELPPGIRMPLLNNNQSPIADAPLAPMLTESAAFVPPGQRVGQFQGQNQFAGQTFGVFCAPVTEPAMKAYNRKVQAFLKWFIDGVSYIDDTDDRWTIYLIFRETATGPSSPVRYDFAAMSTVYSWWAPMPYETRLRLSQILVLPCFQRTGLASQMLEFLYAQARSNPLIKDVLIEDASDDFAVVRDIVDVRTLARDQLFTPQTTELSKELLADIKGKLKLYGPQIKRCFECYLYMLLNKTDPSAYRKYRLRIKRRLYKELVGEKERNEQIAAIAANSADLQEAVDKELQRDALIKNTLHEFYKLDEEAYDKVKAKLHGQISSAAPPDAGPATQ